MLQLLRGAFRTPGLPSVGDVLGSPSTKGGEGGEGDGPTDLAGDHETAIGKRDAKGITEDTATTPLSRAQTKRLTSLQLELRERMDWIVQADVDGHREQAEHTSGPGEGRHAKNTLSARSVSRRWSRSQQHQSKQGHVQFRLLQQTRSRGTTRTTGGQKHPRKSFRA
ncbi:hypothetical protein LTR12_018100 [Friedmanniomyces endolithicus]|nr:hypothetical protein LTR12_018100 [Friedmanniomyces endolithicus]